MSDPQPSRWGRVAVLVPALVVAACAVAATAHGGYEVAVASQVPSGIAWLYPVSADGLALVAYAATHRLSYVAARIYAWIVVVLAAALSGLAQAVYLASGPALDTSSVLRFGVGAWPAVAGAVAAHLVYLLARRPDEVTSGVEVVTTVADLVAERAPLHSVPNAIPTPPAGIPVVAKVSPARTVTPTASARVEDVGERAAQLIAAGAGRNTLVKELGVTPHQARTMLEKARA